MPVSIFKDEKLQRLFDTDGFVVIPFLSAGQVASCRDLYENVTKQQPQGFHSTSFNPDINVKQKINTEVENVLGANADALFTGIKKLGSSFLTKPEGATGAMPVHQDWTIVDE